MAINLIVMYTKINFEEMIEDEEDSQIPDYPLLLYRSLNPRARMM